MLLKALPYRWVLIGAAASLVAASALAAAYLPSTFFPEIDESMERVYVRLAPGTSLADATQKINEKSQTLAAELPNSNMELILTNVGAPNNARSAMNNPNAGPRMGFIRLALANGEQRTLSQHELADKFRRAPGEALPGRGLPSVAGWPASSPTATSRRWWWRCAETAWSSPSLTSARWPDLLRRHLLRGLRGAGSECAGAGAGAGDVAGRPSRWAPTAPSSARWASSPSSASSSSAPPTC